MLYDSLEAQTQAFLRKAQLDDHERYAAICARYPVKTKRELRTIAEIEILAGLQPRNIRPSRLRVAAIRTARHAKKPVQLQEAS